MSADTSALKKIRIGARCWRTSRSHIRFSSKIGRKTFDGRWPSLVLWMASRTKHLWAVNANWNDDELNVEANSLDNPNDWNAGNRFLSRNSHLSSPPKGGDVFVCSPRFQPPTILPISSMSFPSEMKWLCAIRSDSHAIWRKNRTESIWRNASLRAGTFSVSVAYAAFRSASSKSSQRTSILSPIPNLSERAILRCTISHVL